MSLTHITVHSPRKKDTFSLFSCHIPCLLSLFSSPALSLSLSPPPKDGPFPKHFLLTEVALNTIAAMKLIGNLWAAFTSMLPHLGGIIISSLGAICSWDLRHLLLPVTWLSRIVHFIYLFFLLPQDSAGWSQIARQPSKFNSQAVMVPWERKSLAYQSNLL